GQARRTMGTFPLSLTSSVRGSRKAVMWTPLSTSLLRCHVSHRWCRVTAVPTTRHHRRTVRECMMRHAHNRYAGGGDVIYYNEFDPKAAAWLRELMAADQ